MLWEPAVELSPGSEIWRIAINRAVVNAGKCIPRTNSPLQKIPENAWFRLVNSCERNWNGMRKTAVNGRIHVVFHRLTEQQWKVKRLKMRFQEFSRIHYCGKTLENACFRLDNSCEHANSGKHYVFPYLQTLTFPENACFSAVNSSEYVVFHSENANERKENTLFAMC